jgi:hypothetical protein
MMGPGWKRAAVSAVCNGQARQFILELLKYLFESLGRPTYGFVFGL